MAISFMVAFGFHVILSLLLRQRHTDPIHSLFFLLLSFSPQRNSTSQPLRTLRAPVKAYIQRKGGNRTGIRAYSLPPSRIICVRLQHQLYNNKYMYCRNSIAIYIDTNERKSHRASMSSSSPPENIVDDMPLRALKYYAISVYYFLFKRYIWALVIHVRNEHTNKHTHTRTKHPIFCKC